MIGADGVIFWTIECVLTNFVLRNLNMLSLERTPPDKMKTLPRSGSRLQLMTGADAFDRISSL